MPSPFSFTPSTAPRPYTVVTRLPYFATHFAEFSFTTRSGPCAIRPPSCLVPRGNTTSFGSVLSGQSIVRLTNTPSLLPFQRMRVQASEFCESNASTAAPASAATILLFIKLLLGIPVCSGECKQICEYDSNHRSAQD